jgi:hypothetical protein
MHSQSTSRRRFLASAAPAAAAAALSPGAVIAAPTSDARLIELYQQWRDLNSAIDELGERIEPLGALYEQLKPTEPEEIRCRHNKFIGHQHFIGPTYRKYPDDGHTYYARKAIDEMRHWEPMGDDLGKSGQRY